jgi:hypothetical protein
MVETVTEQKQSSIMKGEREDGCWVGNQLFVKFNRTSSFIMKYIFTRYESHIFKLSYYCCTGGTLWHLQKFLWYIIVEFTPSATLLYFSPLPPFLEKNQWVSFFHLHTCVHNIPTIFILLHLFLISSSLPLVAISRQDLFYSCPPFLIKDIFVCLW